VRAPVKVRLDHPLVFNVEIGEVVAALIVGQQLRDHADRAARIGDMHDRAVGVGRRHPQRGVDAARRRTADQQRHVEVLALHLAGDVDHLVE